MNINTFNEYLDRLIVEIADRQIHKISPADIRKLHAAKFSECPPTWLEVAIPEMEKRGYDRAFSCALTSASSTLANLIPPSLGLIIYAALASVSVGALFIATVVPGLLASAALVSVVYLVARQRGLRR